jgi:hypothetical protein
MRWCSWSTFMCGNALRVGAMRRRCGADGEPRLALETGANLGHRAAGQDTQAATQSRRNKGTQVAFPDQRIGSVLLGQL